MRNLVHPKERAYFALALIVSAAIYVALLFSAIGITYLIAGAILGFLIQGIFTGQFRGNAVLVSERQFPDVHAQVQSLSSKIGVARPPAVYVVQSGGVLNAFATRFLGRSYVVLYSEVVELAREEGEDALAFVIAHELAHHHRKHTGWKRLLIAPASFIPFLGSAYSRACEYTCDAYGTHTCPDGAVNGLLVLAAGKRLYRNVDQTEFARQVEHDRGFWVAFAESLSSHPNLPKRVAAVQNRLALAGGAGVARAAPVSMPRAAAFSSAP